MNKIKIDESSSSLVDSRVDKAIIELKLCDLSRSKIEKLIDEKKILINEKPCKSSTKLKLGDVISYDFNIENELINVDFSSLNLDIEIVYEDEFLAVINKPRGLVVHPANGHHGDTLVDLLKQKFNSLSDVNGDERPGIVHRIDKDTSGLLVIAKTNEVHASLSEQLANHSMAREYYAVVKGVIKEDEGKIIAPIGRDTKDRKKMAVDLKNGKEAISLFKVIKRFSNHTFISVKLLTGRTHQIRVHMNFIGHSVEGDPVYCRNYMDFGGQLLHAYKITFVHPRTSQTMTFETPIPEYLKKSLEIF